MNRFAMCAALSPLLCLAVGAPAPARAQAVVAAWGNVEGIRVAGQLIPFETSLCTTSGDGRLIARTAKERQQPRFVRDGSVRTITTRLGALSIVETVDDSRAGEARVHVRVTADSATAANANLCLDAPRSLYPVASRLTGRGSLTDAADVAASGIVLEHRGAPRRRVTLTTATPAVIRIESRRDRGRDDHHVRIPILAGPSAQGQSAEASFVIRVSGDVDRRPVSLALDASRPGREWDGLGGNFRIQNPAVDPRVIQYNLEHLRVAWGRVEMPWRLWHPEEGTDPSSIPPAQLNPRVRAAMEMAKTVADRGAPVAVAVWFPPQWAVLGPLPRGGALVNGQRGNQLDPAKMAAIYRSIGSYLLYLKQHYGVDADHFSFNESDLGIDVRQTPQEHNDFNKGFGEYVRSQGLRTKMWLGDVSDATPTGFIGVAMADTSSWKYLSAVSYHSWRGWSDSLLTFWSDAAKQVGVPLVVGEGSTDAGAWRYPAIFKEADFALEEIDLYVRMLALSEPRSILQWQLTSDYSLLAGGGVYGDTTPLRPTQRFWNLKQLASTPGKVFHLPIRCSAPAVHCAALGSAASGTYAVHVVNRGPARSASITGLPAGLRSLRVWTTDHVRPMQEGRLVPVRGGRATLTLAATSYVTLMGTR